MPREFPILGAHMSIAGGYYKAVDAAAALGMLACQLFTKNNNQWRAKPITDEEARQFHSRVDATKIRQAISHTSYLLNLASPDKVLWQKSVDAFVVELERADQLGLCAVVIHPGAHMLASEDEGIANVIEALNLVLRQTAKLSCQILLETTAGQGSCLGHRFEQLAAILAGVSIPERVNVCLDTCHVFAAGYPLGTRREYNATMRTFDQLIGLGRIKAFHLNDSKKPFGSRVDRHEHIGRGALGCEPFQYLLNDRRFRGVPMCLETPKGEEGGEDLDAINLRTLQSLISGGRQRA
jgi:deoxyribonuclease IV